MQAFHPQQRNARIPDTCAMVLSTRRRSARWLLAATRRRLISRGAVGSTHRRIRLFHVPSGRIILSGALAFWFLANRRGLVLVPIAARQDTQQHQCAESGWNGSLNTHHGISFLPCSWRPSAGIRPRSLLACRPADDGWCTRRITGRIAGWCNNIAGRIGLFRRFGARDGTPRLAGVLRKRILCIRWM